MEAAIYRPSETRLPAEVLHRIATTPLPERITLCAAVTRIVWGVGWRHCVDDIERSDWLVGYAEFLEQELDGPHSDDPASDGHVLDAAV
jgi:hypothetical protein